MIRKGRALSIGEGDGLLSIFRRLRVTDSRPCVAKNSCLGEVDDSFRVGVIGDKATAVSEGRSVDPSLLSSLPHKPGPETSVQAHVTSQHHRHRSGYKNIQVVRCDATLKNRSVQRKMRYQ